MQHTIFTQSHSAVTAQQRFYNCTSDQLEKESAETKNVYSSLIRTYNRKVELGIHGKPDQLILWDEKLDLLRDKRITTLYNISKKLYPIAEKLIGLYDDLILQDFNNKKIDLEAFSEYLVQYKKIFDIGGKLPIYQSCKAQVIRRAIKKYLNWPNNILEGSE